MAGSPQKNTRRLWVKIMPESELHKIAEIQAAYEEIVKRLLTLNSDIFWMLMQHISTEDMSEQLKERQEIDNLYKKVTD